MSHVSDGTMTATPPRYTRRLSDKSVIVRCVHRPKRLPRRRKAVAIVGPAIVTKAIRRAPADTPPVDDEQEPAASSDKSRAPRRWCTRAR